MRLPRLFQPRIAACVSAALLAAVVTLSIQAQVSDKVLKAEAERVAVIAKVKSSVLAIFGPGGVGGGGSGVLIDKEGYALTNFHVVGKNNVLVCGMSDG